MKEPGPFDRMMGPGAGRDQTARLILIILGLLGVVLIVLVLAPFSPLKDSGDSGGPSGSGASTAGLPKVPEGFEALSRVFTPKKPWWEETPNAPAA
jgi:hypothetical protein